eukprot:PhF_6_TR38703/c0_g1_i1/m.57912
MSAPHVAPPVLGPHTDTIWCLAISESSKTLWTGSADGTIRPWNLYSLEPMPMIFRGHAGAVTAIQVVGEDVWSASTDKTIKQWSTAAEFEGPKRDVKTIKGHLDTVRCILHQGDVLYSGGSDCFVGATSLSGETPAMTHWKGHSDWVTTLTSSEGTIFSGSYDKTIRGWDATGKTLFVYSGHANHIKGVAPMGMNNWMLSVARDGILKIWAIPTQPEGGSSTTGNESPAAAILNRLTPETVGSVVLGGSIPTCAVTASSSLFLGATDHRIRTIRLKHLETSIKAHVADCLARYNKAVAAVEKATEEKIQKFVLLQKKALNKKKKALPQPAAEGQEPPADGSADPAAQNEAILAAFSEDQSKELNAFKSQQETEKTLAIKQLDVIKLEPYVIQAESFVKQRFVMESGVNDETITALAALPPAEGSG